MTARKRLVILESPYEGNLVQNLGYLWKCLRDSLLRGEAPFASHGLYTHPGILDHDSPFERIISIDAGLAWRYVADACVVYTDLGITKEMEYGIKAAVDSGKTIEYRKLYPNEAH